MPPKQESKRPKSPSEAAEAATEAADSSEESLLLSSTSSEGEGEGEGSDSDRYYTPVRSPAAQTQPLPTIGIIDSSPIRATKFYEKFIHAGNNKFKMKNDQDFPECFVLATHPNVTEINDVLKRHVRFCKAAGCDIIILPIKEVKEDSELVRYIAEMGMVAIFCQPQETSRDLAVRTMAIALNYKKPIKRFNFHDYDQKSIELPSSLLANLASERERFAAEIDKLSQEDRDYYKKTVGCLGGAGPLASAQFCHAAAEKSIDMIAYHQTSAPGKHPFAIKVGPNYVPHYQMACDLFEKLGIAALTIPCNTAHTQLQSFCPPTLLPKIVDFRGATIAALTSSNRKIILLGTNATVGVNIEGTLPGGSYLQYYLENKAAMGFADNVEFLVPNSEQQKEIIRIIYMVKEGKIRKAKTALSNVITQIRGVHEREDEGKIPVILACTELPIAFPMQNLSTIEAAFYNPGNLVIGRLNEILQHRITLDNETDYTKTHYEKGFFKFELYKEKQEDILRIIISLADITPKTAENYKKMRDFTKVAFKNLTIGRIANADDKEDIAVGPEIELTDSPFKPLAHRKISLHGNTEQAFMVWKANYGKETTIHYPLTKGSIPPKFFSENNPQETSPQRRGSGARRPEERKPAAAPHSPLAGEWYFWRFGARSRRITSRLFKSNTK